MSLEANHSRFAMSGRASIHNVIWPPCFRQAWITRENVNALLGENGMKGEVDLLSIDVDGNDYWLLKEISAISPRVIVLEFNQLWGDDRAVSVPYQADFVAELTPDGSDYAGASLPAFVTLLKKRGYRLVGTNTIQTNAFFIRNDIDCTWLPEVPPADCFSHPRASFSRKERFPRVQHRMWVDV